MNSIIEQIVDIFKAMPPARKLVMGVVLLLVAAGFAGMFFWANKVDFQPAYTNLSPEDAAEIVGKLKELRIPFSVEGNGQVIMVPAEKVYDIRLSMAGSGIPKGGVVGFEIFDETNLGTTEFVQKLNYQRALQGELARTIREFREVVDARVMIVMPKRSVFIEESKPPSASVLLKLNTPLSQEKVAAVVHLVASAVEDLTPDRVTVVDTVGRVLSKGVSEEEKAGTAASTHFEYKVAFEQNLTRRIQTMLEKIVGDGKAIVRVTADMDFDQVDINQEIYDPDGQVVRSKQSTVETSDKKSTPTSTVSSVNPATAGAGAAGAKAVSDTNQRQNETVNYEINKTIRRTSQPVGTLRRLSVAAVLDGTYTFEASKEGRQTRKFVPRSQGELEQFEKIVRKAMGYNADREDQVSVESFPFSYSPDTDNLERPSGVDWVTLLKKYGRSLVNILLMMLIFLFIVRPLVKTMKGMKSVVEPALLAGGEGRALLGAEGRGALPAPNEMNVKEKAAGQAKKDVEKTANLIRGWLDGAV